METLFYLWVMNETQTPNTMQKVAQPQLDLVKVEDALTYFVDHGMIQNLSGDAKYYVQRLVEYAALKKNNEAIVFDK